MKRALDALRDDQLVRLEASKSLAKAKKQAKTDATIKHLKDMTSSWEEMGLRHAHGYVVNPPPSIPRLGSSLTLPDHIAVKKSLNIPPARATAT